MGNTATLPDVLTFEVTVTLEDQLALQMRCLATPAMQAGRLRRDTAVVLIAVACVPFILAGSALIAWAGDRHGPSLGSLFRFLVLDKSGALVAATLVMVAFTVGGAVLQRWLVRPRLRRVLRQILRARPDVDPSDPHLAYRARVTVSGEGMESRTGTGMTLIRWDVLKRWEETDGHLMVLGDAMVGFCLRTSAVDPGPLERLRTTLTAHLGQKTT